MRKAVLEALEISNQFVRASQLSRPRDIDRVVPRALPRPASLLLPLLPCLCITFVAFCCTLLNATAYMWRNNVAGVRNCSSAAEWRNVRRYSSQCSAVTDNEFKHVLSGIKDRHGSLYRTGLAISGGVDSMALASLFARSRGLLNRNGPPFANAFIVDHKARPGSTEEAEWVAEQCRVKCRLSLSKVVSLIMLIRSSWHASLRSASHLARQFRPARSQAFRNGRTHPTISGTWSSMSSDRRNRFDGCTPCRRPS